MTAPAAIKIVIGQIGQPYQDFCPGPYGGPFIAFAAAIYPSYVDQVSIDDYAGIYFWPF